MMVSPIGDVVFVLYGDSKSVPKDALSGFQAKLSPK
jgi:hypothetical protein